MRLVLATFVATVSFIAAACGEDGSKYDRQYPAPSSEQNMMRVLRTHTTPTRTPRRSVERKESDTRAPP
jgi:hypothetical protein